MPFSSSPSSSSFCSSSVIILQQFVLLLALLFSSPSVVSLPTGGSFSSDPSILITVKTTMANHRSRVEDSLATWASMAGRQGEEKTQILFVTDSSAHSPSHRTQSTKCPPGHTNAALCCKMAVELRIALQRSPDFWCHFDDDNFVLIANLRAFLRQFRPHIDDLYLGRPSTSDPIVLPQLDDHPKLFALRSHRKRSFWFGTGGAGLCLSASTLSKLHSFVSGEAKQKGHFQWICAHLGVPDDVALGFILENLLGIPLTRTDKLHSHLDRVDAIPRAELTAQISLSGSGKDGNRVNVPEQFRSKNDQDDLLRFRSLFKFILTEEKRERRWSTKPQQNNNTK